MRAFFLDLLNNLDKLAGLRQLENIQASSADPKAEINELLSVLVNTANMFSYIPEQDQKNIIYSMVITDPEFKGLNARMIYKCLSQNKDRYFRESQHIQEKQPEDWQPLTGEARLARLKEWQQALAPMMERVNSAGGASEKRRVILGQEHIERVAHHSTPPEEVERILLHNQWIRENIHPITQKPLPGYMAEEQWLEAKSRRK